MSWRILIFLVTLNHLVFAQGFDPEPVLLQAGEEFNAGRYYGLPALLKPVIENSKTTNEQLVRAYLLLTQAYLILDDPAAAEDSYLKLLKADPEYVANPARDPIDVYYLSKKFTSTPIITPHIRAGFNTSVPRIIHELTVSGTAIDTRNVLKIGVQLGMGFDLNLTNKISICAEGNYANKAFKRNTAKGSNKYFGADNLSTVERQNWFDVPLYIKYSADSGKIRPFGYAGFAFNFLFSSRGNNWEFRNESSDGNVREATGPAEQLTYKRNFLNRSLVLGGGAKYKVGKNFLYADLRYMVGLSNLTREENIYYLKEGGFDPSVVKFAEVSDFFRLDNLSVSIGFIRPIYNPRKKSKSPFEFLKRKHTVPTDN
ncbi:MAG: PorT family protein [Cyclobacteriaceae bacterium]|nr:PorT family protein [Cyclobacteriaceae bacterium]